ncbi:MAG: nicotinate (nicotinamide) nucleotide adenylyltransferase [Desulfobulbaceae bacterium]|nr:nicotinate (nicotinamide) nucleotide adenylyltransferase [Desulfobulbaceae bacterium]
MSLSGLEKCRKVGIFGGTFDPVHEGHMRLAAFVLAGELVEHILFLPAAQPPHKMVATAPFSHRVNMLETVVADQPAMTVSLLESRRHGPSYTVDSLRALQDELPDAHLFFLLGADSLLELHLWYRFTELFNLADLIVVARSGLDDELCYQALRELPGHFTPDSECRKWTRNDGAGVWYLTGFSSPVSSSEVRRQLALNKRPRGVDPEVLAYIQTHKLYGVKGDHALHS